MKKQKTLVKKLRIGKETLLPLESRQMEEVAGGHTQWFFDENSNPVHVP
jgi:hypothetical protein